MCLTPVTLRTRPLRTLFGLLRSPDRVLGVGSFLGDNTLNLRGGSSAPVHAPRVGGVPPFFSLTKDRAL